ncbi:MAG: MFS transporter [Cellulomonas iranensis]|uniref:MFS transporter n=1 Tax=Cellulomonas iranensis TaxID=76862 RepID=UPI001B1B2226|nr:MFS transporter [Cellulomonas iranensis]MBO9567443.1 MFS transporter [Cellulomonas iranensis]
MPSSLPSPRPARHGGAPAWAAVGVLTSSTFLVVTSEMLPVGVLTPMAEGLGLGAGTTGLSLTVTGLVAAATAPLAPRLLGAADRRLVLAAAMGVLALGNVLTTVAAGLGTLLAARAVLGIGMGVVWGLAPAVAPRLVVPARAALAVSWTLGGVAAASVLGVPLGTLVGDRLGWRAAFGVLAGAAFVAAGALLLTLPRLPRPTAGATASAARRTLLRPAVVTGLAVVVLLVSGHFAAYTYVRPVLESRAGLPATSVALLLLTYGASGVVGNFAAGAAAGRRPRATVLGLGTGVTVAVASLALVGTHAVAAGLAVAVWGAAYGGVSVAAQLWVTASAPDRAEDVTGLYVGVFTAAIALGAFAGGAVLERSGMTALLWGSTVATALAVLVGLAGRGTGRGREAATTEDEDERHPAAGHHVRT